mgnify:CR=1 FL=1
MLDGIHFSKNQAAVVALSIDSEGRKHALDFRPEQTVQGSSETLILRMN